MFVRARIEEGTKPEALLVPQRAVTRDQNGRPQSRSSSTRANKVERRTLVTDRAVGDAWLVTDGLAAGERVIVEGLQKVRPGAGASSPSPPAHDPRRRPHGASGEALPWPASSSTGRSSRG